MSGTCGLSGWETNSFVRHGVSTSPGGPFTPKEVAVGAYAHNPQVVFSLKDRMYLMFTLGGKNASAPVPCTNSTPTRHWGGYGAPPWLSTVRLHYASSPEGPWLPRLNSSGQPEVIATGLNANPTAFVDPLSGELTLLTGMFTPRPEHKRLYVVHRAKSWKDPFVKAGVLPSSLHPPRNCSPDSTSMWYKCPCNNEVSVSGSVAGSITGNVAGSVAGSIYIYPRTSAVTILMRSAVSSLRYPRTMSLHLFRTRSSTALAPTRAAAGICSFTSTPLDWSMGSSAPLLITHRLGEYRICSATVSCVSLALIGVTFCSLPYWRNSLLSPFRCAQTGSKSVGGRWACSEHQCRYHGRVGVQLLRGCSLRHASEVAGSKPQRQWAWQHRNNIAQGAAEASFWA
jgi:hypothetical protein